MMEDESMREMYSSADTDQTDESSSSTLSQFDPSSRLIKEFDILGHIGSGAFANVYQVRNKLDSSLYAIKRIKLNLSKSEHLDDGKIRKEVELLSRLNHQNVVRYYNSWIEDLESHSESSSIDQIVDRESENDSSIVFERGLSDEEVIDENISSVTTDSNYRYTYMYIQMEFCEKSTLRNAIDNKLYQDQDRLWRLIEQTVEGLAYIHENGIIHRDLKPDNIFIDGNDHVKLGDFGLATLNNALQGDTKASHTGDVGTPMYDAPELKVNSGLKVRYDQKIDMYSLGIIFFEMCYPPFQTSMERKKMLTELRESPVNIPRYTDRSVNKKRGSNLSQDLLCPNERQTKLIRELLDHDPEKRPNSSEVSKNGYLVLDKMCLHSSAQRMDPNTSLENISSSRLTYLEDFDFHDADVRRANLLEMMIDKAREIFRLHGGIYSSPCLPSDNIENPASFDHLQSFAYYLVDHPRITHMKRYTFNEVSCESSFMKSSLPFKCARFDIVSPTSMNLAMEAEALLIVCEFLERFLGWIEMDDFVIRLNHSLMVPPVMSYLQERCGKKRDYMGRLVNPEMSCINFALKEYASLPCIHDIDIDEWEQIQNEEVENGSSLQSHIYHLKRRVWRSKRFHRVAFNDLKCLVDLMKSLEIKCPIVIAPSLMKNHRYSKIMFQVVRKDSVNYGGLKNEVMAAGGRYDDLITVCKQDCEIKRRARQSAVGLTIYLDQFVDMLGPENKFLSKFEVLVCSANANELLKEKLDLAKKLWAAKIRCTVSYVEHKSLEEIQGYCREMKIHYILFLEKTKLDKVTLCSRMPGGRFQKKSFAVKEVVPHLKKTIKVN
ncbi:eIF-2-alpha kinase GCN2-like [Planococcus citri]|uniref:eIF-2-alpha kinase GCN2-like n=1 Tax=Planococcus citri TaxID=170843 RepID=UPI0031FA083F